MTSVEYEAITRAAAKVLGIDPAKIRPSSMWDRDLGADSLDLTKILILLAEEFKVSVPVGEFCAVNTVADAEQLLKYAEHRYG